jgi:beta-glucanase (GH16 family)
VRDGEMQVTVRQHADGHWSTTGFNSFKAGKGITYGTVEFDARAEHAQGIAFGILMWPSDDSFPPEIDILETPNGNALHTLHWSDEQGEHAYSPITDLSYDPGGWHHYKLTWLPEYVMIQVDGQTKAFWTENVPKVPMSFGALGFVGAPWDGWMGGPPDASTPDLVTLHLDNVVMSQWNGIA